MAREKRLYRRYVLMQMKFMRGENYGYDNCGIPEDSNYYKPQLIERVTVEDKDYLEYLEEIIKMNDSIKGRKYDTVYYLADGRFYYGERKDKFMKREFQETLMEDFFDSNEYIFALGKSGVVSDINPNKIKQSIHIKYCQTLRPYHYRKLGIYRLDTLVLNDIKDIINHMEYDNTITSLDNCISDIKDGLKLEDSIHITDLISKYKDSKNELRIALKDLVAKLDDDGYYKK